MDPLSFLANLLLSVTVGTLMVALAAYMAYKLRERRKPAIPETIPFTNGEAPVFLRLYVPEPDQQLNPPLQKQR
jgi:uncharacterized membrane protein YfcA